MEENAITNATGISRLENRVLCFYRVCKQFNFLYESPKYALLAFERMSNVIIVVLVLF